MQNTLTLVWDYHGTGRLVGVFDDRETIEKLRRLVADSHQESYVRFSEVKLNEVVSTSFSTDAGGARSS